MITINAETFVDIAEIRHAVEIDFGESMKSWFVEVLLQAEALASSTLVHGIRCPAKCLNIGVKFDSVSG